MGSPPAPLQLSDGLGRNTVLVKYLARVNGNQSSLYVSNVDLEILHQL